MWRLSGSVIITILTLLSLAFSCTEEDPEPRTREKEWEELDAMIKEMEADGKDVDTTDLSVFYVVIEPGQGTCPDAGDTCSVSYFGYYLTQGGGFLFEDSGNIYPPDGKWVFVYKPEHQVDGFIDGLGYMNEGSHIEMYIHSDFAFGKEGSNMIPPYTTLVYRAKMHEIRPREE